MSEAQDVTILLRELSGGDKQSADRILPLVYDELRRLARHYLQNERSEHTLQATALVHEAYLRLVDWQSVSWQNRAHFFAVAAQVMRKVLIDHARSKKAQKREGALRKITLDETVSFSGEKDFDLLALEEALEDLETFDARQARVVELRFFGGLSIEETAFVMDVSPTTVKREWTIAKIWFQKRLTRGK